VSPSPRESPEEKSERERAEAAQSERIVRAQTERAAVEAAAGADDEAWVATLPKWEYLVFTETEVAGPGTGRAGGLQEILNRYAAQGWRVVAATASGKIEQTSATDENDLYVILERPVREREPATDTAAPPEPS
jgi:Domain of unknown function (DUF4177)